MDFRLEASGGILEPTNLTSVGHGSCYFISNLARNSMGEGAKDSAESMHWHRGLSFISSWSWKWVKQCLSEVMNCFSWYKLNTTPADPQPWRF